MMGKLPLSLSEILDEVIRATRNADDPMQGILHPSRYAWQSASRPNATNPIQVTEMQFNIDPATGETLTTATIQATIEEAAEYAARLEAEGYTVEWQDLTP